MHACCLCVCSACLSRHVAIDLSDVASCAKECSSDGKQKQVAQKDRLVAGFIVEDMLPLSTIVSPRFRKILDKIPGLVSQNPTGKHFPISLPEQVLYRHGIGAQNNLSHSWIMSPP